MASITVDYIASPRIITLDLPDTTVTIQALLDLIRASETDILNMAFNRLATAEGKTGIGLGEFTGITLTLKNAKFQFADRPGPTDVQCLVTGGNLVADDDAPVPVIFANPIEQSLFVQGNYARSVSPSLVTSAPLRNQALPNFRFKVFLSSDHITPATGKTVLVEFDLDNADNYQPVAALAVEIGGGVYRVDLAGLEMDGVVIGLRFSEATVDTLDLTIVTAR